MQNEYSRIFIEERADPFIYRHTDGYYYFTASVPAFDLVELRRAKTLEELPTAETKVIWRRHESGKMSMNIWAPEIHYVSGKWYIYFAAAEADADEKGCFDHRTYILENASANPMEGDFVEAGKMETGWESFTIDATSFEDGGRRYFVWAQRDFDIPGNSNLYIAEMESATKLRLPAKMITRPEYPWECIGFLVNEGAAVLKHDGKIFLTYSGSATDENYCMGMLVAESGKDLTDPANWTKLDHPVMVTEPENGVYGPGHNSFTVDEEGNDLLVFHARPYPGFHGTPLSDPNRHCRIRKIRYDENGYPIFNA